jgi:sulfite reductase alpha subunit-like flavoprotein
METTGAQVPSRAALRHAVELNTDAGHENLGFLSDSHGFVPVQAPRLQLPASHRVWDDIASHLPELWRTVGVRAALARMPVLDADRLGEADLWRASCLLSVFAHSFVRNEPRPAGDLPASIQRPWDQITQRLGRPRRFLSYNDLIVYNWRLRAPDRTDPMRVENLELLVPTVGNQEERVFYLTQVEILAQCAPIVSALVRAQEAVVRDDRASLEAELLLILERLQHVTEVSFQKIDPNPLSDAYVNPVVWATTVAPFAVPIEDGTAGPSGTASPIFHALDTFFDRKRFESVLGKEALHLRPWFPQHQQRFVQALGEISVADYVSKRDPALRGLFTTVLDAYAGSNGYLGVHRQKVYGYLEIAFKVGRAVTIGGFAGAFRDRAWKEVDGELESSRSERYGALAHGARFGVVERRDDLGASPDGRVRRVVLDVSHAGMPYRPGDQCRVLPENADDLVDRTLAALRARGAERIALTHVWRDSLRLRPEHEEGAPAQVELRDFLRYAKLRPLLRPVGKALLAVSASDALDGILEARLEDQWELWDVLELLEAEGYDVRRLWRSELWQDEAIARIVPPEPFRTYSVSSMPDGDVPRTLDLTVGRLEYRSNVAVASSAPRRGTASTYLTSAEGDRRTPVDVVRPTRFRLPDDPARAIVMFAGGTGISPFRAFLQERAARGAGSNWLFFSTRTREELYYREELERLVAKRLLEVRVAFSRDDVTAYSKEGRLVVQPAAPARTPDLIEQDDNAAALWHLLRPEHDGGDGAVVYLCGQAGFAAAVLGSLRRVVERFDPGHDANAFIRRLVAERRLMQDVFTTFAPASAPGAAGAGLYDASELALHNDEEHGYWLAIDGNVYDVTEFLHLHPGGPTILRESVGLDASREYRAVLHHEKPAVDAQLPIYKIGAVRRLDFGSSWGIALVPGEGIAYVPVRDLFRAWVRYLYLVVEMENALRNDFGYLSAPLTQGDAARELNPLKIQLVANTHVRFLEAYFDGVLGSDLGRLFALTVGACAPHEPVDRLGQEIAAALDTADAKRMRAASAAALFLYEEVRGVDPLPTAEAWDRARRFCAIVEERDQRFLSEVKHVAREGVQVFEELQASAVGLGGDRLVGCLDALPALVRRYCSDLTAAF